MSSSLSVRRRPLLLGFLGALAAPWGRVIAAEPAPGSALRALVERHVDMLLEAEPFYASMLGVATPQQASSLPMGIAPAQRRRMLAWNRRTLAALQRIDIRRLDEADAVTHDVRRHHLEDAIAGARFPDHLLPIHHLPGHPLYMLAQPTSLSAFAGAVDHERHLTRLAQVPAWCRQAIANLREGVRRGIVLPTVIIERVVPMLRALAQPDPTRNAYAQATQLIPAAVPEATRRRLVRAYHELVARQVAPAVARLAQVLDDEVRPHGRKSSGLGDLPDGKAWYAHLVRSNTTTALGVAEIHALGLAEVERLRGEMAKVQAQYGFSGSLEDFLAWHGKRPEARPFKSEREVLDAFAELDRRIAPQLPRLFGRLPKAPLEIRPEPELTRDTASDHYEPPAIDGSRPGVFYAVITDPREYATTRMAALFLHEARPGHHYQASLAQELPLNRMQRFWFYDAFGEGWALYAETLGHSLGLYGEPDAHLGHLGLAMLRAVRLVVDTGLHEQGWTRERAIQYLVANTGFSQRDARAQIERYMVAPGQALSYAIGRMKIESLRDKASAALGERFSLAAFHDEVLGSGSVPLSVLEAKIDRWIGRVKT
ncbi:DUF885 domain-containing protein [Piscinibacter sp. XHJ-5]|uniref:DUF885 domain-containing protein n=1 Tax=Piscinibacter sp. XHJ-5 TaxID=3037797 RepID=UPI002452E54B|nr:DUF885 domain-containing protein [Piscinibacter sp. XHJ-5]